MADGRHFENSFIDLLISAVSYPTSIKFDTHRCKFPFQAWKFDKKNRNFSNSRWRTDAILKIVFGYISAPYWPIYANFGMVMKNHMQNIGHLTKTAIFANSKWRTAAILKIALSPLSQSGIIRFLSNLVRQCKCRTFATLKVVFWLYLGALLAN